MKNNYKIYNDDCLQIMKKLPDHSVDLILTDPPYNLGQFMKNRQANIARMRDNFFVDAGWDNDNYSKWCSDMSLFFGEANRVLKKKGTLLTFMSVIKVESIITMAQNAHFYYKTTGVWHKKNPMPRNMNLQFVNSNESWIYFINNGRTGTFNNNGKLELDFIETSVTSSKEKKYGKHPTQKPVKLMEHFIKLLSNSGDIVLDPFMGSGSTGVAAMKQDRLFYGIEIDPKYYNIASNRLKNLTVPESLDL